MIASALSAAVLTWGNRGADLHMISRRPPPARDRDHNRQEAMLSSLYLSLVRAGHPGHPPSARGPRPAPLPTDLARCAILNGHAALDTRDSGGLSGEARAEFEPSRAPGGRPRESSRGASASGEESPMVIALGPELFRRMKPRFWTLEHWQITLVAKYIGPGILFH